MHQCIHSGFGLQYFKEDLTGPEYASRFIQKAKDLDIDLQLGTMVIKVSPDKKITAWNRNRIITLNPNAIMLAMGCRERTREALRIPGTRPAGIFTAGVAQRYVNIEGFLPGSQAVILGSGDVGMIMARRLTLEGVNVKVMVEILPYISGLTRNWVQCINDFDIPLLLEHTITKIHGKQRVEGVTIAEVDKNQEPIIGSEQYVSCDTVIISAGLIPENELSRMAGIQIDPLTGGPIIDDIMQTSVPGIFAGGNVTLVHDLVDNVTWQSELAGAHIADFVIGRLPPKRRVITLKVGKNVRCVVPQKVSSEKGVTLYMRVKEPQEDVDIRIGDVLTRHFRIS